MIYTIYIHECREFLALQQTLLLIVSLLENLQKIYPLFIQIQSSAIPSSIYGNLKMINQTNPKLD